MTDPAHKPTIRPMGLDKSLLILGYLVKPKIS